MVDTSTGDGAAGEHVRRLREGDGGDLGVHGSIRLVCSSGAAGPVEEYRLVVSSTVAGRGERSFASPAQAAQLDLVDVQHTQEGTLFLTHRPH